MLTHRFTPQELETEIAKDLQNVLRYLSHQENKYRRAVKKASRFPFQMPPIFYTSPMRNEWLIWVEAPNKKAYHSDYSKVTFVVLLNHSSGIYCFMPSWTDGNLEILVYPPHFFSRYSKRMGLGLHGRDIIARYFRDNNSYVYSTETKKNGDVMTIEVGGSTKDGVALGLKTENGVLFKTFVTYDMLKGQQIEVFTRNEQIRKEIHESD